MERFKIDFLGKSYDAVELNGDCVSTDDFTIDNIIIAEESLNDVISICINDSETSNSFHTKSAWELDDKIFGFAPKDLIINGSETELKKFANGLL